VGGARIAEHIVIRREEYVAGTRERPEVGVFTQKHILHRPVPWGRIAIGERVWMKWTPGPIVARAEVADFLQLMGCTPEQLRETTKGFGLYNKAAYWESLPPSFHGMTIYLRNEEWLDIPIRPRGRSQGGSWIILSSDEQKRLWLEDAGPTDEELAAASDARVTGRSPPISASLRFVVLRRDRFSCTYCGRRPPEVVLHVDHVVPRSKGGRNDLPNLRTSCLQCNLGKGARLL
jgi:hypothetical protein